MIAALILPPVPFLLLVLIGARLLLPRRGLGWLVIFISVVLLWLSACTGAVRVLSQLLSCSRRRRSASTACASCAPRSAAKKPLAIVILGAGSEPFAPEYGVSSLQYASLERLRYGLWLGRPDRRAGRLQRRHRLRPGRLDVGSEGRRQDRRRRVRPADPLGRRASRATRARTRR